YNLIAQVARQHQVHLLSFADTQSAQADVQPLRDLCASLTTVPTPQRSPWRRLVTVMASPLPDIAHRLGSCSFEQELIGLWHAQRPTVVQIEGLEMASYGLALRRLAGQESPRLVFDAHNAEYLLQQRIFESDVRRPRRWLGAIYSWLQWQKLRRYEAQVCRRADRVIACSPADARALAGLVAGLEATIVPNGVDIGHYQPGIVPPLDLGAYAMVFTGKMDFRPNVDAVLWFCSQVLLAIQQRYPSAHLYVVGKNPHPRLAPLKGQEGVTITGFVEDVRPYIGGAAVYIVPLLTGGGTRLKVLEAMAMGQAVVSTTLGCEGIDAVAARDVVLADQPDDFAAQVCALLQDPARRRTLGQAARTFVEQHSDWPIVARPLEALYAQ
ncbi:MAG: glycosyltransferase, partial [Chloroflexi bacterium]|nr:glycosyltransferase [Chloroflexota bacterium]